MIIDPDSNGETILQYVSDLLSRLDKLHEKAIIYKNYQKNFKVKTCDTPISRNHACLSVCVMYCLQVEVTRFEDLEETHAEVKLKQTLWESQREWEHDYETWTTVSSHP